jgi:hypothetical protein
VEFRLLFEGKLPSHGDAQDKQKIRQSFHPQLRRLWSLNPNLRQLAAHKSSGARSAGFDYAATVEQERFELGLKVMGRQWNKAGCDLLPLVTSEMALRCSLDIVLLRPEEEKFIFKMGDIDGQLKTLFDGLRIPNNLQERGGIETQGDEVPLFCLLEDDRLITEVRVTTDQLLLLPNQREVRADDAHAVIHVKINHKNARTFDNYFG